MIRSRIASLPKVELHLHLEGSLRPETVYTLADRNDFDLAATSVEELSDQYNFRGFDDFLQLFLQGLGVLQTREDFAYATERLAVELADQNVRYAEVTTTPYNHARRGVDMGEYVAGLDAGRQAAGQLGVEIGWICDIPRELEPPAEMFTAKLITGSGAPAGVVALGLGGPEPGYPPALFTESFALGRASGLGAIPHAGETEGPESVWSAINDLNAARIGHGVRSIEDDALVEHLANNDIALEICLSSNQALGVVSVSDNPFPKLRAAGVPVTLNTDDPAYFATDLNSELVLAAEQFSLEIDDLVDLQLVAVDHSLAGNETKSEIKDEIEDFVTSLAKS